MRLYEYIAGRNRRLRFPWTGAAGLRQFGYTLYEIYRDPRKHLQFALEMDRLLQADFVYPLDYGRIYAETLGLPLLRPDYDFPSVLDHPVHNRAMLDQLSVPDPYTAGPMPAYLEALHLIAASSDKPLALSISGPFTLGVLLVGAEAFARAIIKDPSFVEAVLDFTNAVIARYAQAVVAAGARFLCISEPTAVLLSPARFRTLVGNRLRAQYDRLPPEVWRVLHICGNTHYLMPEMIACGAEGLSLDQVMDFPALATTVPPEIVLIGNLDPIHVLRELAPPTVRRHTLDLLRDMLPYPNYLFSFGCDCAHDTPLENLQAAMEAARTPHREIQDPGGPFL